MLIPTTVTYHNIQTCMNNQSYKLWVIAHLFWTSSVDSGPALRQRWSRTLSQLTDSSLNLGNILENNDPMINQRCPSIGSLFSWMLPGFRDESIRDQSPCRSSRWSSISWSHLPYMDNRWRVTGVPIDAIPAAYKGSLEIPVPFRIAASIQPCLQRRFNSNSCGNYLLPRRDLLCEGKRRYLQTCKINKYCILPLTDRDLRPVRNQMFTLCWFVAGLASQTVGQHWNNISSQCIMSTETSRLVSYLSTGLE